MYQLLSHVERGREAELPRLRVIVVVSVVSPATAAAVEPDERKLTQKTRRSFKQSQKSQECLFIIFTTCLFIMVVFSFHISNLLENHQSERRITTSNSGNFWKFQPNSLGFQKFLEVSNQKFWKVSYQYRGVILGE